MKHTIGGREIDFETIWPAYLARLIAQTPFPEYVQSDVSHLRAHREEALPLLRGYRPRDVSSVILPASAESHRLQLCEAGVRHALADIFCGPERFADEFNIAVSIDEPYPIDTLIAENEAPAAWSK